MKNNNYKITKPDQLKYTIDEYFKGLINNENKKRLLTYLNMN